MNRYLTHFKQLREPEEPLDRFFKSFKYLEKHLGPVLLQLPERLHFKEPVARYLFALLKTKYAQYQFALEARHATWFQSESLALLTHYNIACVIAQSDNVFPYVEHTTTKHIYLRLHGPHELFASGYSPIELQYFASRIRQWRRSGKTIWVYFNNDVHGYAFRNASYLQDLLETSTKGQHDSSLHNERLIVESHQQNSTK